MLKIIAKINYAYQSVAWVNSGQTHSTVDSPQSTVGRGQWTVDIGQWACLKCIARGIDKLTQFVYKYLYRDTLEQTVNDTYTRR